MHPQKLAIAVSRHAGTLGVTNLVIAAAGTYDYLLSLRSQIATLINDGGSMIEAQGIDQSAWAYLFEF